MVKGLLHAHNLRRWNAMSRNKNVNTVSHIICRCFFRGFACSSGRVGRWYFGQLLYRSYRSAFLHYEIFSNLHIQTCDWPYQWVRQVSRDGQKHLSLWAVKNWHPLSRAWPLTEASNSTNYHEKCHKQAPKQKHQGSFPNVNRDQHMTRFAVLSDLKDSLHSSIFLAVDATQKIFENHPLAIKEKHSKLR